MVAPVVNMPSNKHSGVSGRDTQLFVQHSAESPLRGGYAQSLTKWAQTPLAQGGPEASWPSFVDPIARVRMVAWPNSAWTQGLANQIAVGLECAGYARFTAAEWLTAEGLKQLENLAHEWCYYLDLEAKAGNVIPLRWLTTTEVRSVMAGNRSIKGFCTHAQIDPASRTDPGKGFPYDRLMNRIKEIRGGKMTAAPATPTAPVPVKDWFDMATAKDLETAVEKVLLSDKVLDAITRRILTYHNTTRTERDFYALNVDGGLNSALVRAKTDAYLDAKNSEILANVKGLAAGIAALAEKNSGPIDAATLEAAVNKAVSDLQFKLVSEQRATAAAAEGGAA